MLAVQSQRGARVSQLLAGIVEVDLGDDVTVHGLSLDSRHIGAGDCFIALGGGADHGIRYVRDAVQRGARAVLAENIDITTKVPVPLIRVPELRARLGTIANRFYDSPSEVIQTVAVTGTNGKTTITSLIAAALSARSTPCGYIGTLGIGEWHKLTASPNTTPDVLTVHKFLAELRDAERRQCAIEASSHALAQGRLDGVAIDVGVFSNLSHDHLDFHGSLLEYSRAKKRLFQRPLQHAVVNADDAVGREILAELDNKVQAWPFGLQYPRLPMPNAVFAKRLRTGLAGLEIEVETPLGDASLHSPLIGDFNASNLLAALASLLALGVPLQEAVAELAEVPAIPGRMEVVNPPVDDRPAEPIVVIDYAHSPDSLERALMSLRDLARHRLVCVFGCGGDRDRAKRPLMGRIATQYADRVVVTNDNPRTESGEDIAGQIIAGMGSASLAELELDRARAIERAISAASADDVVLIAGKGHEQFQQLGDSTVAFSDRLCARAALDERRGRGLHHD